MQSYNPAGNVPPTGNAPPTNNAPHNSNHSDGPVSLAMRPATKRGRGQVGSDSTALGPYSRKRLQPRSERVALDGTMGSITLPVRNAIPVRNYLAAEAKITGFFLSEQAKVFLRSGVKGLPQLGPGEHKVAPKHINSPTILMENSANTVGWIGQAGDPKFHVWDAKIPATFEHMQSWMASMLLKCHETRRSGNILKIRAEICPSYVAKSDRAMATSAPKNWFNPPCGICDRLSHITNNCFLPSVITGASQVTCPICLGRNHNLERCQKFLSTNTKDILTKLWEERENKSQFSSALLAWHDAIPVRLNLLDKTIGEINQILQDAIDDELNPYYPWTFEFAKEVAKFDPYSEEISPENARKFEGVHPVNFMDALHDRPSNFYVDPTYPFDDLTGLVNAWIKDVVDPEEKKEESIFVRDRVLPGYVKKEYLNTLTDAQYFFFEAFKKHAKQFLHDRGAIALKRHPKHDQTTGPLYEWLKSSEIPKDKTWNKNASRHIKVISRGLYDYKWEIDNGNEVLKRIQRTEGEIFAFNRDAVYYWVNTWVDEIQARRTIDNEDYKESFKLETKSGKNSGLHFLFSRFWHQYNRQDRQKPNTTQSEAGDDDEDTPLPDGFSFNDVDMAGVDGPGDAIW